MTRPGLAAFGLGLALAVMGWVLVWPAVFVLGAGSVAMVLSALAYAIRRPHLGIEREIQPARVEKGSPAIAFLTVVNRGTRSAAAMTAVQPYGASAIRVRIPRLRRGDDSVVTYHLPTSKRGVFDVGPIELTREDPFGLACITQRHVGVDQIRVHPLVFPLAPLPSGITRHVEGPTSDMAPEGDITFHRLREYVVGDDLRMIHWKSTARVGQLMVRHNVDTSQPFTVVVFDMRPDRYSDETFETAVDAAASVATATAGGRSPVQLRTTTGDSVGGPHRSETTAIVEHLTAIAPDASGALTPLLLRLRRERGGTALVVVTGALDEDELPVIATLRGRFQCVVVVSVTPHAIAPPTFPGVDIVAGTDPATLALAWNLGVGQ